jgi:5'-nucleotidase
MLASAGFRYTWDGAKACDARISGVTLTRNGSTEIIVDDAGKLPNPTRSYRVTVNNFMASGGDGFTTFTRGTQLIGGAQDIDALVAALSNHKAPRPAYDPAAASLDKPRISRIGGGSCPTGTNTNP